MFTEMINIEDFYSIYGGQKFRRIATPRIAPFIYLIHSEGEYKNDNLDVEGDGSHGIVFFSAEMIGERKSGNKAVLEHAEINNSRGMYRPLLLFDLKDNQVRYIGEYKLIDTVTKNTTATIDYFVLKKVDYDVDAAKVYLVEHIDESQMILSPLPDRNDYFNNTSDSNKTYEEIVVERINGVEKGQYVTELKDHHFGSDYEITIYNIVDAENGKKASSSPEEKKIAEGHHVVNAYSDILSSAARAYTPEEDSNNPKEAYYYLVNVSCGLTSFLVLVYDNHNEVWGFDWGAFHKDKATSAVNVSDCLNYIKLHFFNNKPFYFSKFFISHPDSDHINLFDENYINQSTEVWMGTQIRNFSKKNYIDLLRGLYKKTKCFVEPITSNSNGKIQILHPELKPRYGYKKPKGGSSSYFYVTKINNVSPLVELNINEKTLIVAGDIMQEGWREFNSKSSIDDIYCDYYIHSHHGSQNGFFTAICPSKKQKNYKLCTSRSVTGLPLEMFEYDLVSFKKDFLSTRDGAYKGIICDDMKRYKQFNSCNRTDNVTGLKFYELDILNDCVTPLT